MWGKRRAASCCGTALLRFEVDSRCIKCSRTQIITVLRHSGDSVPTRGLCDEHQRCHAVSPIGSGRKNRRGVRRIVVLPPPNFWFDFVFFSCGEPLVCQRINLRGVKNEPLR